MKELKEYIEEKIQECNDHISFFRDDMEIYFRNIDQRYAYMDILKKISELEG